MSEVATEFMVATVALIKACAVDMKHHRDESYPEEAVGILCADGSSYPLINQARSSRRFEVSETLLEEAIAMLNEVGKHPVAIYHSHPESASGPSRRDIEMMKLMPGALSVIVGIDGIAGWVWDDGLHSAGRIDLPEVGDGERN